MPTAERSRIWRHSSNPSASGQHQVEQHDVGRLGLQQLQRACAVGRHDRVEPPHRQVGPDQVDDVRVVLHQQGPGAGHAVRHHDPCPVRGHCRRSPGRRATAGSAGRAWAGGWPDRPFPALFLTAASFPIAAAWAATLAAPTSSRAPLMSAVPLAARTASAVRAASSAGPARSGVAPPAGGEPPAPRGASTGSRITKLVPFAGLRGRICPPCATTIPWAIDSPRPAPALAECPRRLSARTAPRPGPVGSPEPLSLTPITTSPPRPGSAVTLHPGPGRVVPDRVVKHVDEHLLQPVMVGPDGRQRWVAGDLDHRRARLAAGRRWPPPAPARCHTSHGCSRRMPDSMAEKSSRSPTSRPSRADSAEIRPRNRSLRGGVPRHVGLQQAGRVAADGGERGAQFVAQPGQEAPLQLLRPAQRGRLLVGQGRSLRAPGPAAASARRPPSAPTASAVARRWRQLATRTAGPPGAGNVTVSPARRPSVLLALPSWWAAASARAAAPAHRRRRLARPVAPACARLRGVPPRGWLSSATSSACRPRRSDLQRHPEPFGHRDGAGQRLQHLPDRLQHPVAGGDLVQQPVPLDRARGIARVHRHQVEFVPLRAARRPAGTR